MTKIVLVIFISVIQLNDCYSQHKEKLQRHNLTFESPSNLKRYFTFFEKGVYGWANLKNDYAVDIKMIRLKNSNKQFYSDLKGAAIETSKIMGIKNTVNGGTISNISNGHYAIGEYEDKPVIILIIINDKGNKAFEISIDCYNENIEVGKLIANSFHFNK